MITISWQWLYGYGLSRHIETMQRLRNLFVTLCLSNQFEKQTSRIQSLFSYFISKLTGLGFGLGLGF